MNLSADQISEIFHASMVAFDRGHSYQGRVLFNVAIHHSVESGLEPEKIPWYKEALKSREGR